MNKEHTASWLQSDGSPSPEKLSLYTLWDLLLSGTTSLSFCHPSLHLSISPSLLSWRGVNLSFLLPADSCAWLSGSLSMRFAPSITRCGLCHPSVASLFIPSLPLSPMRIDKMPRLSIFASLSFTSYPCPCRRVWLTVLLEATPTLKRDICCRILTWGGRPEANSSCWFAGFFPMFFSDCRRAPFA